MHLGIMSLTLFLIEKFKNKSPTLEMLSIFLKS